MNKYQKLVQERFLDNEEAVINALKSTYEQSYKDITKKIESLDLSIERLQKAYNDVDGDEIGELAQAFLSKNRKYTPEEAKETLQSMLQSKVYQRDYQKALEKQIDGVLGKMLDKEYKTISDYLTECYEDSFIGTMFDLKGQGIPLCFPLDQEAMVNAVQLDSPIKKGLYEHLGENVGDLKKKIASEVSRGISTGMSFEKIARNISLNMMGTYENPGGAYAYALRIARTEGHRIQCQGTMDACFKAKEKGADVVKQWDSTLDGNTRESHQKVDGEIRELDEKFSNGLMFPGDPSGGAAEVVNCRCALLQRAKWALDEAELETLKERAEYFGLDKSEQFEDFKKKYLKMAEELTEKGNDDIIIPEKFKPAKDIKEAKTRFSKALGLPEESINLGRMKPELANQYLEGVERFTDDFPMLKGYYSTLSTKTGSQGTLGLNKLTGTYVDQNGARYIKYSCELHFKNPQDVSKMMKLYAAISENGEGYANSTPLSTAIHELVHGIDKAITLKKHGAFDGSGLNGLVFGANHGLATSGVSRKIIQQVRQEMFGTQYGKDVAEATRYLGKYARTSPKEELAEAISYEYVNPSNPYSARILELFKEEVKGTFGK